MADKDLIIRLLETTERRMRANRILRNAARILSIALLAPVALKIVDLISPLRGATVLGFFTTWSVATAAVLAWRSRGRETLQRVAADLDGKAGAPDQLKTAYWFIRNPKESPWIETQIRRAAEHARAIRIASLYPRALPQSGYLAVGLVVAFGILNFLPLPWNDNWLYLHAAPAFRLDDRQRALLEQALEELKKAEELQQTELAQKLAQIIQGLQNGNLSQGQLSRSLAELQQALAERKLDIGRITDGLERIAKALAPSETTKPIAKELFVLNLKGAASETRTLAKKLDAASSASLQEMSGRFQEASEVAGKGLEQLAQYLQNAAAATRLRDIPAGRDALEQIAKEFERLQRVLDSQRLRNEASAELAALQDSVEGVPGEIAGGDGQGDNDSALSQGQGESDRQGVGEGTGQGEGQGEGEGVSQGEGQGEQGDGEGVGEGDDDSDGDPGRGGGRGGKRAGLSGPFPSRGEPTELETQFQKEALPVKPTRGSRPETIEEHSERERSKLDYRNAPSKLTPAQKDVLNQDPIPFEQRQFVKEYLKTVHP